MSCCYGCVTSAASILPGTFLEIAERLGMVREIAHWVTGRAIALLAQSIARGEELTLEVNLSLELSRGIRVACEVG